MRISSFYSCTHRRQLHACFKSRLLWWLQNSKWRGSIFILVASKIGSGISENGRARRVLPRAFSCGKWNRKSRTVGDLPAPQHRD